MEVSPFALDETVLTLSDGGWTCKQALITPDGKYIVASEAVTGKSVDDRWFAAALEPALTAILDADQYLWFIEIENLTTTPVYRREISIAVGVQEHRIWNTAETSFTYAVVEYATELEVTIDVAGMPAGTPKSIKLLDTDGTVLQTVGFVSSAVVASQVVITLTEPVKIIPISMMINI